MSEQQDLFDTFDQAVRQQPGTLKDEDLLPNLRIQGEVVLEPVMKGIRVTARDADHALLWGFIGSREILGQPHCPVAIYDTLLRLLEEELDKQAPPESPPEDRVGIAQDAVISLIKSAKRLQNSLAVKKVSPATQERAEVIARVASDALRMIELETSSLKGMKPKQVKD